MKSILIIEDDDNFRSLLKALLEVDGYNIIEASNGRYAFKILQKESPDLIITDLIMDDIEGIEIIMKVKEDSPKKPIIAISGGGSIGPEDYLESAKDLGADQTFSKPFTSEEMLDAVKKLLS